MSCSLRGSQIGLAVALGRRLTLEWVMVWYVALVAVVNLGLGYGLAVYLGVGRRRATERIGVDGPAPPTGETTSSDLEAVAELISKEEYSLDATDERPSAEESSPANDVDPVTDLKTRTYVEQRLQDLVLAHADRLPVTIALVEVDEPGSRAASFEDRLLRGIAGTIRNLLTEAHTAGRFSDQQFLLLLLEDDLQQATMRTEQVRQRVATTQYLADGNELRTTLTCALAQVTEGHSNEALLEFLTETLNEAKRYGGNRTFMHDGTSPTPVLPPELSFAPQTCAI